MMKRYLKMSIMLLLLFSITFLANTKVQASEITITEEQATKMLNLVPDSMEINLKEIDNTSNEAETLVKEKIHEIWAKNDINMEEVNELENQYKIRIYNSGSFGGYQYSSINDFYKAKITIEVNGLSKEKDVKIIYSNHKNYNVEDEKYVKSLKIEKKKYFEVKLGENLNYRWNEDKWITGLIDKYYEDILNDKSITIKSSTGMGDRTLLNDSIGGESSDSENAILIFRNGILYDRRPIGMQITIPVITIPYYLQSEEEIQNYALNLIKNTYSKEYDTTNLSITKGISEEGRTYLFGMDNNIKDGYTVTGKDDFYHSWVILRKEKPITSTDKETNIQFEASKDVVPANTVLEAKIVNDETTLNQIRVSMQDTSTKYVTYDITLKSNNVAIQPNGKVQVSIPIPKDFDKNNLVVYRIEPSGNKIAYEIKLKSINGQDYAVFETDHFSNYVLAEKLIETTTTNQEQQKQPTKQEHKLDNEPKTGYNISKELGIVLLVITIAIVVTIRRYNK